ncbi:NADP-dependent isocitrate dehydrogenase [Helicobacter winghamensis]|uniref:Isocitrate dehydrogenase [NADP] n=1 Tax=Helicobacter winghamensis TaxID=157268 RepID=A0A2N3PH80_9HELI|nr:NADP-dependent isocitrate dehydrogenase [Helicobacter winghamensis]PKT75367.1 isocitrate dehydrogenase, NADP-dependent [Helicobacter winghamensis]PKT75535.1 isocitrate dehydrogenase, NADP-dependent [Helicobacter winghamensis]PKT79084.1 isocitrate dehydrogenase, NADP-dependent [Helicobacter winghamensis]PKT79749.1 isocitrate dehydrogenase, NADP-dependent [Helicobacter winghamensis]PKT79831.1 isocitrate dehydrogenase, NADP-dependent [Helicobacter winghamensis]
MKITYTLTDESPALATYSFLPIVQAFLGKVGIPIETSDISLAARVLAQFTENLLESQRVKDSLKELGELVNTPNANLIKTPNISASIPQLKATIKELQEKGFAIPDFPDDPSNASEKEIKEKYQKVLGSAVNPVLRQGNSDRRCTKAVKDYARKNPYKITPFNKESKTRVSYIQKGDFFDNEKAILIKDSTIASISFIGKNGTEVLKENLKLDKNEILDATFMSAKALRAFYKEQIEICKNENILLSLHLKATMMKVSDPVIFGHAVSVYFKELFDTFGEELHNLGVNPNNGVSELLAKIENSSKKAEILEKYNEILAKGAPLSMVNSDKGITNLHIPSDVIVDASMPAMLKNGARLWDKDGKECDTNALIPDKTYATIYEAVLEDLRANGTLDPSKLGSVSNVGLMAKKAQEYGSHDKTFIAKEDGIFKITDAQGNTLLEHSVEKGDIYRANTAKFDAVQNWIDLGIERADLTGSKAIFWLDLKRPSNKIMADLVQERLKEKGKDLAILAPKEACLESLKLIRDGKDAISITGNVLRDYLTDLFPILELGTSAKMLSVVPMLNGGAMFETGAGGSAPKQVEQLVEENHLRWDSLGEFLALQASLEFYAQKTGKKEAQILADSLDIAIGEWLNNNKAPSRKAKEDDNRTSHFYLALYFAKALANNSQNSTLQNFFKGIFEELNANSDKIHQEFINAQGVKVDLGGYYKLDDKACDAIMRPSATFNAILAKIH